MIPLLERYAEEVVRPLLAQPAEALRDTIEALRLELQASWARRERFYACPRPATPPTSAQAALLGRLELLESVLRVVEPPVPAGREIAPCSVEYTTWPYPGQVVVTCLLEGTVVASYGHGEKSRARSFALLREECPCGGWHEEGELSPEDEEEGEDEGAEDVIGSSPESPPQGETHVPHDALQVHLPVGHEDEALAGRRPLPVHGQVLGRE